MKTFKKSLYMICMIGMLILLAACQDDSKDASSDSNGETGDDGNVTLTIFDAETNPDWENMESPIGQKIKEETGVTIKPEFDIEGGETKIPLMIASGEYPDLILSKGAGQLVEAEALVDLAPLIEEHAPNLKKMLGDQINRLKWSKEDPSIYVLTNAAVDDQRMNPNFGVWIQHAAVKELGYPEIKTLEDVEKIIKEYKELHPTIDGQSTIGLTVNTDEWRIQSAFLNSGFMMTGGSDDGEYYIDPETYEATLHYRRPVEKEVFKWYNKMNAQGLLDTETFVQKDDQFTAKLASGRVIAAIGPDYLMHGGQSALRDAGLHERMYGVYPVTLNEDYVSHAYQSNGLQAGWGISITKDNPDPVKTIKFLDYLASDEAQVMLNWGIEGEHYEVIDGKRVIPEDELERRNNDKDYLKETGMGYTYLRYVPHWGDGVVDDTGNTYTINTREQVIKNQTDIEKEVLAAYGVELWKDLYPQMDEFPVKPWGAAYNISIPANSNLKVLNQRAVDTAKKRVPESVLASPENFDKVWEDFMSDLEKIKVDEAEKEYTQLIKEKLELWNE